MTLHILLFAEAEAPKGIRVQIVELQQRAWPSVEPPDPTAPTHDPALDPKTVVGVRDGKVIGALDILTKRITHAGSEFLVSGLSTVVTDENIRGAGYGQRLVAHAHEYIAGSGADLGLFSSDRWLAPFYEGAGWMVLPGTVLIGGTPDDPLPTDSPEFDKVVLGDVFTEHAKEYAATFVNARIELYPGSIDRLW